MFEEFTRCSDGALQILLNRLCAPLLNQRRFVPFLCGQSLSEDQPVPTSGVEVKTCVLKSHPVSPAPVGRLSIARACGLLIPCHRARAAGGAAQSTFNPLRVEQH